MTDKTESQDVLERKSLLSSSSSSSAAAAAGNLPVNDPHDEFLKSVKHEIRCITVEPLVFLYCILMNLQNNIIQQYIYFRVGVDYNIVANSSRAYVCDITSNEIEEKAKVDKIQDLVSLYQVYIEMAHAAVTILTAPFYCVLSDRFGRKYMLILPGIGFFIKSCYEVLIIRYKFSLYNFILASLAQSCFGGFQFAFHIANSYYADISTKAFRIKGLAILGIIVGTGSTVSSIVLRFTIKAQGFMIPYFYAVGISFFCILYPIFLIKEPPKMTEKELPPLELLKTLFTIYIGRTKLETATLILLLIVPIFCYVAEMTTMTLIGTYLMAYPICMSIVEISYTHMITSLAVSSGTVTAAFLLNKYFTDITVIIMSLLNGLVYSLQMTFVNNYATVYIAAATNLFSFSVFPFIRGYLSKKMRHTEQGALFGGLILTETVASAISKVIVIHFYRQTFRIMHGLVYVFLSCFSVIAITLTVISKVLEMKLYKHGIWADHNQRK